MKFLIASDIHGSAYYAELLVRRFEEERAERLLLLGDILYHGPRNDLPRDYNPKNVIALLNPLAEKILCVRGNCESEVDQMVLPFPVLNEYAAVFTDGLSLYLTHGHHLSDTTMPIPFPQNSIVLSGHTHVPQNTQRDGIRYLNPGSVSIPKEHSPYSYMTLEDHTFLWKNLTSCEIFERLTVG